MGVIYRSLQTDETYSGETPDAVVTDMARRIWPDADPAAYMLDYAERAKLWNGSEVETLTAGRFLESLEKLDFLAKIS